MPTRDQILWEYIRKARIKPLPLVGPVGYSGSTSISIGMVTGANNRTFTIESLGSLRLSVVNEYPRFYGGTLAEDGSLVDARKPRLGQRCILPRDLVRRRARAKAARKQRKRQRTRRS